MDAWLAANVDDERDPRRVLDAVADAMRAIRVRSEASLGAGAASVIFERLVAKASGGFAALSGFSLDEPSSDVLGRFRRSDDVDRDDVLGASRELLVETLAVLASLTGDALTTALHGELAASGPRDRAPPPPHSPAHRRDSS
ncbi:MAG TPA: hypothetical protein VIF62_33990 [Labilithrix sp.]